MKRVCKTVLLLMLVALTLVSFKSEWGVTDITLEGKVGKYPIVMELQMWGSGPNINGGWYYYKSQGPNNRIDVSNDLNFDEGDGYYPRLEESVNDKVTGTFYASHWDMNTMSGTWISADGKKQFPFTLKVIKADHHYMR